ncbi:MAG: hypothetical protein AAF081_01520 [Actinomycetota bacterium]
MDHIDDLDAPDDVMATIEWLIGEGFEISRLLTRDQPNGNKLLRLQRGDEHVHIVRDRGPWELGFRGPDWVAGLHTFHEAATGVVFDQPPEAPMPRQLPSDDLLWAEAVPAVFAWRAATPDWRTRLEEAIEAGRERIRRRFG